MNFKRFEKLTINTDSDITLFLGPNSSGKSSIIKSLLGLKQTVLPSNESEGFSTQGDYVDLGTYHDFVHNHNSRNTVTLSITVRPRPGRNDFLSTLASGTGERYEIEQIRYDVTLDYNAITEQPRIYRYDIQAKLQDISVPLTLLIERKKTRDTFNLSVGGEFLNGILTTPIHPSFRKRIPVWRRGISVAHVGRINFRREQTNAQYRDLPQMWLNDLQRIFHYVLINELFYIGPIRSAPARNYVRTSHSKAVGPHGEYTASVLANLAKRQQKVTTGSSPLRTQYTFLRDALQLMFPGKSFTPQTIHELVRLEFYNLGLPDTKRARGESIMDVGFGFSQIFPILVQLAVMPKGATLIVEQPELHLHPLAQSRLAQVFRLAVKDGKRVIAETHSDHLIRGIQLEVSKRSKAPTEGLGSKDVSITYVGDGASEPIMLSMNNDGEFDVPFPSGFMDVGYLTLSQLMANKVD